MLCISNNPCVSDSNNVIFWSFLFTLIEHRFQTDRFLQCIPPVLWWYSVCLQSAAHELLKLCLGAKLDHFHISGEIHTTWKTIKDTKSFNWRENVSVWNKITIIINPPERASGKTVRLGMRAGWMVQPQGGYSAVFFQRKGENPISVLLLLLFKPSPKRN